MDSNPIGPVQAWPYIHALQWWQDWCSLENKLGCVCVCVCVCVRERECVCVCVCVCV
jgi:hypothetical protein